MQGFICVLQVTNTRFQHVVQINERKALYLNLSRALFFLLEDAFDLAPLISKLLFVEQITAIFYLICWMIPEFTFIHELTFSSCTPQTIEAGS